MSNPTIYIANSFQPKMSKNFTRSTFGSVGPLFVDKSGPGSQLLAAKSGPPGPGLVGPTGPLFSRSTFRVIGHRSGCVSDSEIAKDKLAFKSVY